MSTVRDFPLFPLGLVALPSELIPLHVFEERYKTMVAHCLEEDEARGDHQAQAAYLAQQLIEAERDELRRLERDRAYPADLLQNIQREIDLDESRLQARARG